MNRKLWLMIAVAVVLGGVSLYLNTDWFSRDSIHIFHRSRPARGSWFRRRKLDTIRVEPVVFGFDRKLRLQALKVVPVSELETNQYARPAWYLVSDSNSVPVEEFVYGIGIKGMRPAVRGATPDELEPGVTYRLSVEAGPVKAEHDFVPQVNP